GAPVSVRAGRSFSRRRAGAAHGETRELKAVVLHRRGEVYVLALQPARSRIPKSGRRIPRASEDAHEQALQVLRFGEMQADRMIGRLRQALDDLRVAPGVDGRAGDDFLKQRRVDMARARERRERSTF